MRNGDRVVATPDHRSEIDIAALAEAILVMLAALPTDDPGVPVTDSPTTTATTGTTDGLPDEGEPAA